ncbi:hypothetical protein CBS63078_7773 [Aspergillus niger]|nr:hypothetical protein CBS115989_8377 [Aspergillus niger]KAI2825028.1 hypothetical protein CBS133816_8709 [Aspergillus niger]KAI2851183.1 hypothetical protein CBS11232_6094 [Aspergillus niger]KAI2851229.1 hypothetical protein CBS11350_1133 [Aspergillus niger]KAI2858465.1 hypothetical protein CBS12448_6134 [Aspergillus niger]
MCWPALSGGYPFWLGWSATCLASRRRHLLPLPLPTAPPSSTPRSASTSTDRSKLQALGTQLPFMLPASMKASTCLFLFYGQG